MSSKIKSAHRSLSGGEKSNWFDKLSPSKKDIFCILILLIIIYILFFKIITSDMIFSDSGDTAASHSWGVAVEHLKEKEHIDPLWVPFIFSGMPIAGALMFPRNVNYAEILIQLPGKLIFLNVEMAWFVLHYFLMGVFMYMLVRQMKFTQLPSLLAAITLMLNPYAIGLAQSGHGTKMMTLTFIPLVFLLTLTLFEKRNMLSFGLLSAATGTMLLNKHPQIAFYGLLAIGSYFVYEIILEIKKSPMLIIKKTLLLGFALAIGFIIYMYEFLPTKQYEPYSIRGGLSYEYATNWSFHPLEALTFVLPSAFGFSTPYTAEYQGQEVSLPLYWGWLPFTDGPVYIGIVAVVLVIFGLIYMRNRTTWFFALFSLLVLFISFGSHFSLVYNLFFEYFPYFNRWRAPQMILYLIPMTFGIIAAYGLKFVMELHQKGKDFNSIKFSIRLLSILGVVGGVLILGFIMKGGIHDFLSGFMFSKDGEVQQYGQQVVNVSKEIRFDVFWTDFVKMLVFIGGLIGLVYFYFTRKKAPSLAAFGIISLLTIDLLIVDFKLVNPRSRSAMEQQFQPDATVKFLQSDTSMYRTFPLGELFQDNTFMYHKISSIGGYSPAKLKIYQEMIESSLYKGADPQFPLNMNVINMLNAKYLIAKGRLPEDKFTLANVDQEKQTLTYLNPNYFPRAWFVDTALVVSTKENVFALLNSQSWNPRATAILEKSPSQQFSKTDSSSVKVELYESQKMTLKTYTSTSALLVISEIYYPAAWKAYIDGTETEVYKTNYILRSVVVPAGNHTIELLFDPSRYETGLSITNAGWAISVILILIGLFQTPSVRKRLGIKEKAKSVTEIVESNPK